MNYIAKTTLKRLVGDKFVTVMPGEPVTIDDDAEAAELKALDAIKPAPVAAIEEPAEPAAEENAQAAADAPQVTEQVTPATKSAKGKK